MSTSRSEIAQRWARVGGAFTAVAEAVPAPAWDDPAPCEGWSARDVIAHLVDWIPGFLEAGAVDVPAANGRDPLDAWVAIADAIRRVLDDPAQASARFEHPRAGSHRLEDAVDTFICADVLVHTWDLATATGQSVTLDPEAVGVYLAGFQATDEDQLVASGQYGPRVPVADDAAPAVKLIALTGRHPV